MRTETEKLMKDLKSCACDAEELVKATAGEVNEKSKEAGLRLKATLNSAKKSCEALEERAVNGVKVADRAIRTYPYESLGVALGIGVVLGFLIGRRP